MPAEELGKPAPACPPTQAEPSTQGQGQGPALSRPRVSWAGAGDDQLSDTKEGRGLGISAIVSSLEQKKQDTRFPNTTKKKDYLGI